MINKYWQYKICKECGFEDKRENSKFIAAFESTRNWKDPCPNCKGTKIESSGMTLPDLDGELLSMWGNDESIFFLDQDEDILIAEESNIELLFKFVDDESLLPSKRSVILSALCVLIYDNTPDKSNDPEIDPQIANKVIIGLKQRMSLFSSLDTDYIMDYIKKVAYPQLGMPINGM